MEVFDRLHATDLDRRELNLTIFACLSIAVLAVGTAVMMYPVVFSHAGAPGDKALRNAFFGFCVLCLLLAGYLLERQATIARLRGQMAEDQRLGVAAQIQASTDFLKTMPKLRSFLDRLPMELRRTVATEEQLSILVVNIKVVTPLPSPGAGIARLADAAKVISRRLTDQDSLYVLGNACFAAVLPGLDVSAARTMSKRISEGLADAAGVVNRFSYKIDVLNYPANASSAHELQEAVRGLIPAENAMRAMVEEALV